LNEKPFGKEFSQWTAEWWQSILSIPRKNNPTNDKNAINPIQSANNRNVLFLVGTTKGSVEREISVSFGKALLIPIINFVVSDAEKPGINDNELTLIAKHDIDDIVNKQASVDDYDLQGLDKYRIASLPFDVVFPEDNISGVPAGPARAVSDGYWLFLKHLSSGRHKISVGGSCSNGKTNINTTLNVTVY
jgi:hypothetical protein